MTSASVYLLGFLLSAQAQAEVPALMKDIVALRAELETISRENESLQKEKSAELDLWVQKKLELEGLVQKETLRQLQLKEKAKLLGSKVKVEAKANPEGKAELLAWIANAQNWVQHSIPFRQNHRLAVLKSIEERTQAGLESVELLSAELWRFYEDEFKMAADNEYRITEAPATGGGKKAEVARLGLVAMYSRADDGTVEVHKKVEGKWLAQKLSAAESIEAVRLLDNLKAKKDSGLYSLPLSAGKEAL
jgi:hypothetical protein